MNDLVPLKIPLDFIAARGQPTTAELNVGIARGWITKDDLMALISELGVSRPADSNIIDANDSSSIDVADSITGDPGEWWYELPDEAKRFWVYMVMSWLWHTKDSYQDLWHTVDYVLDDLWHPEELIDLHTFYPGAPEQRGIDRMKERWQRFLKKESDYFRRRKST